MIERDVLVGTVSLGIGLYLFIGGLVGQKTLLQATLVQWLVFAIGNRPARGAVAITGLVFAGMGLWLIRPHTPFAPPFQGVFERGSVSPVPPAFLLDGAAFLADSSVSSRFRVFLENSPFVPPDNSIS